MGEVYKATDTRLDRTVAIKVLLAHVADDPDLHQRFEREAKTISSLNAFVFQSRLNRPPLFGRRRDFFLALHL